MIPAIDPGIGIKEDLPTPPVHQAGTKEFSRALGKAQASSAHKPSRSIEAARPPGDPRARARYGKDAGRPAEDVPEDGAAKSASKLEEAAGKTANPHLAPGGEVAPTIVPVEGEAPDTAALALQFGEEGAPQIVPTEQTPIAAQIGQAAWRLGPHGNGEGRFAQGAGAALPGTPELALEQAATPGNKALLLEETELAQRLQEQPGRVALQGELVTFSDEASGKAKPKGIPIEEQVALATAQNRNKLLSRIAAAGDAVDKPGGDPVFQQNLLREQLQLQGMLQRNARASVLDSKPAAPPHPPLDAAVPPGTVDLTQVFETPKDDAVEQRVIERVAQEARWLINNNRSEATIRLHPDHLGQMHIKVVHKDGALRIEMTVDNQAAKHLLEANLNDLRTRLAADQQGAEFFFNVDVRKGNDQPGLQARTPQPGTQAVRGAGELEAAAGPSLAARVMNHGGLSIYA